MALSGPHGEHRLKAAIEPLVLGRLHHPSLDYKGADVCDLQRARRALFREV